ncbi:MAG: long-chain fatty acid--CoA ligase [Desulfobacteraceae bacterium]|nr:long-chain fatty acid--CoA ligase [Desulfobacteraceae bacterium]
MNQEKINLLDYTIPQLLRWRVQTSGDKVALREKKYGIWKSLTWNQYYDLARKTALGLENLGLGKNDKLALITDNIPEMLIVSIGAQAIGAISAGIYQSSLPGEIADILNELHVKFVFCENQEQADKLLEVRSRICAVERVIYEDPRGMRDYRKNDWFVFIEDLYKHGEMLHQKNPRRFNKMIDRANPDDICHLCLTSGTTGLPKGAMMTHRNYINMGFRISEVDQLEPTDEYVSFLPFAWIGEQMNSFGIALATGITINFPESVETIMSDLKEIGPHFMFGAPRIYETIQSQIWFKIDESYWFNRKLYHFFIKIAEKAASYSMTAKKMPFKLSILSRIGKIIVFNPLINQLGLLRLRRAYTGGAALGPELFKFYHSIGINLKQIYGQTEITGIAYMHRDGDVHPDTVGKPLPGTECEISEKGEILSKSASVCSGYYELAEQSAELLSGGWLHSGDAGYIDSKGHLVVIDRLSDVMHNQKGEMFSPMFLENKLKFSPYIKEAIIFGDQREFVSAMINIDPVIVGKWAENQGISFTTFMDLSLKPQVADLIKKQISQINSQAEKKHFRIKRFSILYKLLDADDDELTKTGKIRRDFVQNKYKDLFDALYDETVSIKKVQATFRYQDGQSTSVETNLHFYTIEN